MDRGIFNILRAIKSEEPPCTGCMYYSPCAEGMQACEIFLGYINGNEFAFGLNPTRKIYESIYGRVRGH
tara:strand:+ start:217 stop:423 length:207 start_codon:yes stop_codon:yes gene_type:complete